MLIFHSYISLPEGILRYLFWHSKQGGAPPSYVCWFTNHRKCRYTINHSWLVVSIPLKNISQMGLLFPRYGKIVTNQIVIGVTNFWGATLNFPSRACRGSALRRAPHVAWCSFATSGWDREAPGARTSGPETSDVSFMACFTSENWA
jgi:hypothetical protein